MMRLRYLATPYTKYPGGVEAAFAEAVCIAARLLAIDKPVFSPIVHWHPIARAGNFDLLDQSFWLEADKALMHASSTLFVATMPGWDTSHGVAVEIEYFRAARKPIYYVNPRTLAFHTSPQSRSGK